MLIKQTTYPHTLFQTFFLVSLRNYSRSQNTDSLYPKQREYENRYQKNCFAYLVFKYVDSFYLHMR